MTNFKGMFGIFLFLNAVMFANFFHFLDSVNAQEQPSVDISLQKYSGMDNPSWIVNNPSDISKLQNFIVGLPTAAAAEPPPFGAFLLLSNEAISGFPDVVLVFDGVVKVVKAPGNIQFFQDTKGFRAFLVTEARKRGIIKD